MIVVRNFTKILNLPRSTSYSLGTCGSLENRNIDHIVRPRCPCWVRRAPRDVGLALRVISGEPIRGTVQPLLRLTSISKSFAGVHALRDVSFELLAGEVHALIGENGAGKSTLVKVITGAHAPDVGSIEVAGQGVEGNDPNLSRGLGIAAIYQQPALF